MKYLKRLSFMALLCVAASSSSYAITISGTAISPALGNGGSNIADDQLVLFVVDRNGDGFSGISDTDILSEGSVFGGDDYILAVGSTGPAGLGFATFPSFDFTLTANDVQGEDSFGIYFFDGLSSGSLSAVNGTYYGLGTDLTYLIPTNNSATFNFSGTADSDSFQQLSNTQATLQVVPEPSTYAAIAGLLALSWVMVRRRRA
ncbi:PEP-CTERM sorting domain-containing protein [Coraliomargarita sp. W4R53]